MDPSLEPMSQIPADPVPVPAPLREVLVRYGADPTAQALPAAWVNEVGGLTFPVTAPAGAVFCKWAPPHEALDLAAEAQRSRWAAAWLPVPDVLEQGSGPDGAWLVSRALPGTTAVADRWRVRAEVAVPALGRALRRFHDTLPVADCPFDWSVPYRLARAVGDTSRLGDPPPVDRLVVCHGDACNPNFLLDDQGVCCGFVDLGAVGVADRWADLAAATMSLVWNYGEGHEGEFLAAYGVDPDPVRTAYYRALWDVGP